MADRRRGPWSPHEDQQLLDLVTRYGAAQWVKIAEHIGSRSPKQCRERYHQNLKPTLNHNPITAQEGALIEQLVEKKGKRWAAIARELPGRSDNAVKNWWNGCQNRQRRLGNARQRHHARDSDDDSAAYTPSPVLTRRPSPIDVSRSHQVSSGSALSTPSLVSDSWSSSSSMVSQSPITPAVLLDHSSYAYGYQHDSPQYGRVHSSPHCERSYSWDSGHRSILLPSPEAVSTNYSLSRPHAQSFSHPEERSTRSCLIPSPTLTADTRNYTCVRDPVVPCEPPNHAEKPRSLDCAYQQAAVTLPPLRSLSALQTVCSAVIDSLPLSLPKTPDVASSPPGLFRRNEAGGQDERMKISSLL